MNNSNKYLAQGAVIAALYVILTLISNVFGLASGAIQIRLSEALTIMPIFIPAAVPGLALGCVISNMVTGCALWDVLFGTLATFLGALGTLKLKDHPVLASFSPVFFNTLIIPFVLSLVYGAKGSLWFFALTVFAGEVISCVILGNILRVNLDKRKDLIKKY